MAARRRSPGPAETVEDSGFIYYGRHFRSADGSIPPAFGGLLQPYGSISLLVLPADNGTWGVGVIASSKDAAMRAMLDVDTWERVVRPYPLVAHWLNAEAITDVELMAKIEDRTRTYVIDGMPVATGVLSIADAWACTNPSLGRGISIGLVHAAALRALLRDETLADPVALAVRWGQVTADTVQPLYDDRGVAVGERFRQPARLVVAPRHRPGRRRSLASRRVDGGAQLVPGERASAHADRAGARDPARAGADDGRVELGRLCAGGVGHDRVGGTRDRTVALRTDRGRRTLDAARCRREVSSLLVDFLRPL